MLFDKFLKLFGLTLLLEASGCSFFAGAEKIEPPQNSAVAETAPFKLAILEEVFDGENLYLRLKLDVLAVWDAGCVSFTVNTLKNAKKVSTKTFSLKEVLDSDQLSAGAIYPNTYVFDLTVPQNGGTDYQLKLNWKVEEVSESEEEASSKPAEEPLPLATNTKIEVANLTAVFNSDCSSGSCLDLLHVEADLLNLASVPVSDIVSELIFTDARGHKYRQKYPLSGVILYPDQKEFVQLDVDISENKELKNCKFDFKIVSFQ